MSYLDSDLSAVRRDCHDFRGRCQRVQLAVQSESEELDLGCSPFIQLDDDIHVYMNSGSVLHGGLLADGPVNLMFLEDEISSPQTFSRRQLTIEGSVSAVQRGYQYTRIMVAFQDRLGSFMDIVRRMPDARLIRIRPLAGRYINELSQVFTFRGNRLDSLQEDASARGRPWSLDAPRSEETSMSRLLAGDS